MAISSNNTLSSQYRFSGFNFPMIQLDSTGPSYIIMRPYPTQIQYLSKTVPNFASTTETASSIRNYQSTLYKMTPI